MTSYLSVSPPSPRAGRRRYGGYGVIRLCLLILLLTLSGPAVTRHASPTDIAEGGPAGVAYAQGGGGGGVRQLDGGGGDDSGGGIVDRIKKTVTNITRIVVPSRTMFSAINQVLARATSGQLSAASGAYDGMVRAATGMIQKQLFPTDMLVDISSSTLPLAAALAVPLFLLRLAIYHWRRLVGGDDTAAAAVGDWIVAGGWAYVAGHLVTFVLKLGMDLAAASLGSIPQLVGDFMLSLSPAKAGAGLLANLIGAGFMGTIVQFVGGLGLVAAAVAVMWAFAVASGLSFILAATGPVAGIVGVIPQMRWLRSLWLKALVLLAIFPLGAGAVFKAAGLLPTMVVAGPVGTIIRLMWLWGAVGFLFALAGIAGRFSIGTGAAVGMGMVKAGKAVVDLGATAAVTGGTGLAAAGAGGGAAALSGSSGGAAGSMSSGVAGMLGSGGSRADGAPAGDTTGSAGGESSRTTPEGRRQAADAHRQSASQSLAAASGSQRAAGAAQAFGLRRLGGVLRNRSQQAQLDARRHELDARREDYLARYGGGNDGGSNDGGDGRSGNGGFSPGGGPRSGAPSSPTSGGGSRGEARSPRTTSGSKTVRQPGGAPGTFSPSSTTGDRTGASSSSAGNESGSVFGIPHASGASSSGASSGTAPSRPDAQAQPDNADPARETAPALDDALQAHALAPPARRQFTAGFRETAADESTAPQSVEQLRSDLVTVTGDESLFQRLSSAGSEGARDVGRLAGAYQQFAPTSPGQAQQGFAEQPVDRLRRAFGVAYGPSTPNRDVPRTINEIVGDIDSDRQGAAE